MRPIQTHKPIHKSFKDLTGDRYGMAVILDYWGRDGKYHHRWLCRCDCGSEFLARGNNLRTGNTISCGCQHSGGRSVERHGMHDSPEYSCWEHIIQRCHNPKCDSYDLYGGRGVVVCDAWRNSFVKFYADMGPRPNGFELDRVDPDGHYEPSNCRWLSKEENARRSVKRRGVHRPEYMPAKEYTP